MPKVEKGTRRELRTEGEGKVRLEWPDALRGRQVVVARALDISERGMKVVLANPIATGTYVQIKSKDYDLAGMAGVKHCTRQKLGYQVGLEFSGFQWRVEKDTPLKLQE
jgi:hypothetical protein